MAKIANLVILNSADKTRHYSVAMGEGAVADADDVIVTDLKSYPLGSQYTDLTNKTMSVRTAANKAVADWTVLNA